MAYFEQLELKNRARALFLSSSTQNSHSCSIHMYFLYRLYFPVILNVVIVLKLWQYDDISGISYKFAIFIVFDRN